MTEIHRKITANHLRRDAYLYVRQSSLKQVYNNTQSTERQYALSQRAVALGWPLERIIVIDQDQGQSGAASDREGFQKLVTEVGMGRAGIVMGLEVSRLARNNTEWHRLLEICALSDTLILDKCWHPNNVKILPALLFFPSFLGRFHYIIWAQFIALSTNFSRFL